MTGDALKKRFRAYLQRYPRLYDLVVNAYYFLQPVHIKEILFGTKAREEKWATRHLQQGSDWAKTEDGHDADEWVMGYWNSRNHPHRLRLLETISSYYPFDNVLEIGCNCGPNLCLLAKKYPASDFAGIDVNPHVVEKGNALLASEGMGNVRLLTAKASGMSQFPDKSYDIVFTDAVLLYIGPDMIKNIIGDMLRISRKALVMVERHSFSAASGPAHALGVYRYGCWERDYLALLRQFVPEERIKITKIGPDVWPEERWQQTGAIIEVTI